LRAVVFFLNFANTSFDQFEGDLCFGQIIRVFLLKRKGGIGFRANGGKLGALSFASLLKFQFLSFQSSNFFF
jgi:hypothetical protein